METITTIADIEKMYRLDTIVPTLKPAQQAQALQVLIEGGYSRIAGFSVAKGEQQMGVEFRRSPITVGEAVKQLAAHAALEECIVGPLFLDSEYIHGIGLYTKE